MPTGQKRYGRRAKRWWASGSKNPARRASRSEPKRESRSDRRHVGGQAEAVDAQRTRRKHVATVDVEKNIANHAHLERAGELEGQRRSHCGTILHADRERAVGQNCARSEQPADADPFWKHAGE